MAFIAFIGLKMERFVRPFSVELQKHNFVGLSSSNSILSRQSRVVRQKVVVLVVDYMASWPNSLWAIFTSMSCEDRRCYRK